MYLRRDSSGRVLSPGPGGWSRPSPAPEEWTHFISLAITPTPILATLLCALEFLNFDFGIPSLLKCERAYQNFQTLKNNLAGNGASGDIIESMSKLRHRTVYTPVYTLYVNPLRSTL